MNVRRVVNVGDTALDLESGWNAGVGYNIGVLSGAHGRDQLQQAPHTHLLASVADLPELLVSTGDQGAVPERDPANCAESGCFFRDGRFPRALGGVYTSESTPVACASQVIRETSPMQARAGLDSSIKKGSSDHARQTRIPGYDPRWFDGPGRGKTRLRPGRRRPIRNPSRHWTRSF